MKVYDLTHKMNIHTPGWVGYAGNKMFYAANLQTKTIQFDIVWSTDGGVIGDAWTDFLPESSRIVADWTNPIKCGNYNIDTGKCSGQNYE